MITYHCNKCKQDKVETEFYKSKTSKCKKCVRHEAREWKAANPERNKETNRKWNANNYSTKRHNLLEKLYGITPKEYEIMFIKQGGKCQICSTHQDQLNRRLAVDHCHLTSKVRGLLCYNCNQILGHAKDNIENILKAAEYLKLFTF